MKSNLDVDPRMSSRSRLFSINPEGKNTFEVESITSYMCRLAFYHGVNLGELLDLEISRELETEYLYDLIKDRKTDYSRYIVGTSEISLDFVQAIEKLTCQKNIINLTFLNWKGLVNKGFTRDKRAWCSLCLEESKTEENETYERLIWIVKIIDFCPKHYIKLKSICPHCKKTNPLILSKMRPGFCSKCQKWLGSDIIVPYQINEWELWKVNNIKYLMDYYQCTTSIPTKFVISNILKKLVNKYSNGKNNAFARSFGISASNLSSWIKTKHAMSFLKLLKFSYFFNIPIVNLLEHEDYNLNNINKSVTNHLFKNSSNNQVYFDPIKLREELYEILASKEEPPPSMAEVIRRLGYSRSRIYRAEYKLCKQISAKRKRYLSKKKMEHQEMIYQEIKTIVKEIMAEGEYPSRTKIQYRISFPIFYTKMYAAIDKVFRELQIENKEG